MAYTDPIRNRRSHEGMTGKCLTINSVFPRKCFQNYFSCFVSFAFWLWFHTHWLSNAQRRMIRHVLVNSTILIRFEADIKPISNRYASEGFWTDYSMTTGRMYMGFRAKRVFKHSACAVIYWLSRWKLHLLVPTHFSGKWYGLTLAISGTCISKLNSSCSRFVRINSTELADALGQQTM